MINTNNDCSEYLKILVKAIHSSINASSSKIMKYSEVSCDNVDVCTQYNYISRILF
jgi:hypothetical protein